VTPPEGGRAAWQQARSDALHTRPRLDSLAALRQRAPVSPARGGLPPGAMRRVREHVEVHLSESMDLAELAAIAGLSVYHFARAFKQSAGVAPTTISCTGVSNEHRRCWLAPSSHCRRSH